MNTPHTWSDSPIHEQIRTMNIPTPISDRIVSQFRKGEAHSDGLILTMVDLELKLIAALAEIDRLDVSGIHSCHSECQKSNCVLRRELTAVTEQRDEAREKIEFSREWSAAIADIADDLRSELTAVTEQRDRLAEAVNAATILIAAKGRHNTMLAYEGLRAAIQSLTPKP